MLSRSSLAPEMEFVGEKSWQQLEIRLFPGADASFTLYEDEGDNYNYEKGVYSTITFHWDNARHTLTIDGRQGSFPGMLNQHQFTITMPDGTMVKTVDYDGTQQIVKL